jgi:hypothetical protein
MCFKKREKEGVPFLYMADAVNNDAIIGWATVMPIVTAAEYSQEPMAALNGHSERLRMNLVLQDVPNVEEGGITRYQASIFQTGVLRRGERSPVLRTPFEAEE